MESELHSVNLQIINFLKIVQIKNQSNWLNVHSTSPMFSYKNINNFYE
jgi:hypothetical protein